MSELVSGGAIVAAASFLSGTVGFGYGLVTTPLLLAAGFSLPFAVTANLAVSLGTRLAVVWRLHDVVNRRRVTLLVAGSIPGLLLGARLLAVTSSRTLERIVGIVIMVVAAALVVRRRSGERRTRSTGLLLGAGLAGGILGTLGSLNGVVPALFLTRDRIAPRAFIADLAAYFVLSSAIGLAALAVSGRLVGRALVPDAVIWLPASITTNAVGVALGPRLPHRPFRALVLCVAFAAGAVTLATAH